MKNLWIALVVAILPLGGLAESSETAREPAAKKEKTVKKAKSSKKVSSKKSAKKAKKAKKIKSKASHKSHAPRMEEPAAASVGEIPESMKDDLPPPNNGDLTE
jgi:hypothetical protein